MQWFLLVAILFYICIFGVTRCSASKHIQILVTLFDNCMHAALCAEVTCFHKTAFSKMCFTSQKAAHNSAIEHLAGSSSCVSYLYEMRLQDLFVSII